MVAVSGSHQADKQMHELATLSFILHLSDEAVPVANTRRWVDRPKELNTTCEYNEMPGMTHDPVMTASLPSIYKFSANTRNR
jgi:hypothetical protein